MNERELMLTAILDCERGDLYKERAPLSLKQQKQLMDMQTKRLKGEPLQYIIGYCDFMGVILRVNRKVLIPRPETEILVDSAITKLKQRGGLLTILDLGTGSGNIAIALAKNIELCKVISVDQSAEALNVARGNAEANGVTKKVDFFHKDMMDVLKDDSRTFDLIISNPPYIPTGMLSQLPEDVKKEPVSALDGGEDGLAFYRPIIENAHSLLKDNGLLMMEIGDGQAPAIGDLFSKNNFYNNIEFIKDYVGIDRIVSATLKG